MQPLTQAQRQIMGYMSESELQTNVIRLAKQYGWEVHHQWTSINSQSGWPDAYMLRGSRALAWEFKIESAALKMRWATDAQIDEWEVKRKMKVRGSWSEKIRFAKQIRTLIKLRRSGTESRLIRPRDWFTGYVEDRLK
jgi:hypothetical protein